VIEMRQKYAVAMMRRDRAKPAHAGVPHAPVLTGDTADESGNPSPCRIQGAKPPEKLAVRINRATFPFIGKFRRGLRAGTGLGEIYDVPLLTHSGAEQPAAIPWHAERLQDCEIPGCLRLTAVFPLPVTPTGAGPVNVGILIALVSAT